MTYDQKQEATYQDVAAGLRHCLELAEIAAAHGNHRRAARHLLGAIRDLRPKLQRLEGLGRGHASRSWRRGVVLAGHEAPRGAAHPGSQSGRGARPRDRARPPPPAGLVS